MAELLGTRDGPALADFTSRVVAFFNDLAPRLAYAEEQRRKALESAPPRD